MSINARHHDHMTPHLCGHGEELGSHPCDCPTDTDHNWQVNPWLAVT